MATPDSRYWIIPVGPYRHQRVREAVQELVIDRHGFGSENRPGGASTWRLVTRRPSTRPASVLSPPPLWKRRQSA